MAPWEEYLKKIYFDVSHAGSFYGPQKLYNVVKDDGKFNINMHKIRKFLHDQESYSLHKPIRRRFTRNHVISAGIDDLWMADLIDMVKYAEWNEGYKYILVVIDTFSKYVWLRPLKQKTGHEVTEAFKDILSNTDRKPKRLTTDKDSDDTLFPQQCGGVSGPGIVGRDLSERQQSNCHECCSTDGCNSALCKHPKPTTCVDDESFDCAKTNSLFHICNDVHQASLVCPKFCHLCTLVDGNWAQWSPWSGCDVTCGNGVQTRSRTCSNPAPANGGLDCLGSATETKVCQKDVCPVHGGWSKWSPWGSCSATCDVGMQRRDRSCSNPYPSLAGDHCFGESRDDRICMPGACSDGSWSSWNNWGTCSASCGDGVKSRLRTCTNPRPSLLGRYCDGSPEQVTMCNNKSCPVVQVAFTANGASGSNPFIFPNVLYNDGNGYNNNTGKFTCPLTGIYYLEATLTKNIRIVATYIYCWLYINSKQKVGGYSDPYDGNDDKDAYPVTVSGTFHLNRNDVVYIGCNFAGNYFKNGIFTTFTGFLINPKK